VEQLAERVDGVAAIGEEIGGTEQEGDAPYGR
jgi:hypothetical protein